MSTPSTAPIRVAVVGHTNAGKTSLMRTLLRDSHFGDVADAPGTTRHVEAAALLADGQPRILLVDTPGLEDSVGLMGLLEDLSRAEGDSGPDLLMRFLEQRDRWPEYAQEAKVLSQLLGNDLYFYVLDVREPLLARYRDELRLLALGARPVIPVLNFTAQPRALTQEWIALLARHGLHATVLFDNVVYRFEDEKRLLQKMQSLLSTQYDHLQQLIDTRQRAWHQQIREASRAIAETLIRVAAQRVPASQEEAALQRAHEQLQTEARHADRLGQDQVLGCFGFNRDDVRLSVLPVIREAWSRDLFDRDQLRRFGLEAGGDAAKGAALGAGIDLAVGGLSLGAASALGAAVGLLWRTGKRYGDELTRRFRQEQWLCVDGATLGHLWSRQLGLLRALLQRGHATTRASEITDSPQMLPPVAGEWWKRIRSNPDWADPEDPDPARRRLRDEISGHVVAAVDDQLGPRDESGVLSHQK